MARCAVRDLRPLWMGDLGTLERPTARPTVAKDDRSMPHALHPVAGSVATLSSWEGVAPPPLAAEPPVVQQTAAQQLATPPQEQLEQLVREAVARHWQEHRDGWWAEAKEQLKSELAKHVEEVANARWSQLNRSTTVAAPAASLPQPGFGPLAQARAEVERVRAWVDALGDLLEQGRLLQERVAQVAGTLQELRAQGGPLLRQVLGAWRGRTESAPRLGGALALPQSTPESESTPGRQGGEAAAPGGEPADDESSGSAKGSQLASLLPLLIDLLGRGGSGNAVPEAGGA